MQLRHTALFLVALAGCGPHEVEISDWVPARLPLLQAGRAAVLDFSGVGGEDVAGLVDAGLRPQHTAHLIDRGAATLAGARAQLDRPDTLAGAARLGAELGADAVLFGQVRRNSYREGLDSEPYSTCLPVYNSDTGNIDQSCTTSYTYERVGALEATVWAGVVAVADGRLLGEVQADVVLPRRTKPQKSTWAGMIDPSRNFFPEDVDALRDEAYPRLATALVQAMRPRRTTMTIPLFAARAVPQSHDALTLAASGDWEEAAALYRAGVATADARGLAARHRAHARYNLGVAMIVLGSWEEGSTLLQEASLLSDSTTFATTHARLRERRARAHEALGQLSGQLTGR